MKHAIVTTVVAALALGVVGVAAYATFFPSQSKIVPPPPPIIFEPTVPVAMSDDPRLGAAEPKHTIIMFGDFQCAACEQASKEILTVLSKHTDTQLVWKDAPNPVTHPWSVNAAIAGRCANQQKKFWEFHDAIYAVPLPDDMAIAKISDDLKLNQIVFNSCIGAESVKQKISVATQLAEAYGVDAVPFFFVDGKPVGSLNAAADFESFLK
ncbi:MAG: thioredoxin domain-containing protein [bacterium]